MLILMKKHMEKKNIYQFNITNALLEANPYKVACLPPKWVVEWSLQHDQLTVFSGHPGLHGSDCLSWNTRRWRVRNPYISMVLLFLRFCCSKLSDFWNPKKAEGLDIKTINPLKLAWLVDRCWPFLERYTDHAKKLLEEGCQVAPSIFRLSSFANTCIFISFFPSAYYHSSIPWFLLAVCIDSEPPV